MTMIDKFNTESLYDFTMSVYKKDSPNIQVKLNREKIDLIIERVNNQTYTDNGIIFPPSAFKKMGHFTALFIQDNISPGFLPSKNDIFKNKNTSLRQSPNFSSSYVAFRFSVWCLQGSTIASQKASIDEEIVLSHHSLVSILYTFSNSNSANNPLIVKDIYALLYEQLVYKTNPDLQYDIDGLKT